MRKLAIVEFVTLDGVMQSFGSPDEDRDGGFEHGGWGAPYFDEAIARAGTEGSATTSAYLLGRRAYEKMAGYWPDQPDENPMSAHLNATPKYVASRTLTELHWSNSQRLEGSLVESVRALKSVGDGTIVGLGSGVLVEQLMQHELVDEYRLFLHPLLMGTGKRLFRAFDPPRPLRLLDHASTSTGVLMLSYATDASASVIAS